MESLRALLPALSDAITAVMFAGAWLTLGRFGRIQIESLILLMLIEFIVMHSFGFLMIASLEVDGRSPWAAFGVGGFYVVIAAALGIAFRSIWPVLMVAWLIGSKLWSLMSGALEPEAQRGYVLSFWLASTLAYLVGVVMVSLLPIPRLARHADDQGRRTDAEEGGLWARQPERVMAFGLFYFGLLCGLRIWYALA
jgi:hypothetical protein